MNLKKNKQDGAFPGNPVMHLNSSGNNNNIISAAFNLLYYNHKSPMKLATLFSPRYEWNYSEIQSLPVTG